ncbi:hypothetical protein HNR23_002322 [Nocardiopsis mwathae]|uniref:DUF6545 domain-containing protein n=1 Tax=Nocardiopsis mwathae TaxID=1472723 RepID=A0A7X0D5D0_9ACTN|nr:MAB_1171c family putative transporter [Nocardiopsis mwathae]MBB6172262.1 hypothetical protein [Nocardiopsis mwathae]
MPEHAHLFTIPIVLIALTHKAWQLYNNPKNPVLWALCAMIAAIGTAATIRSPAIYTAFDEAVGIPNLARLIEHLTGIIGLCAGEYFLLNLNNPETSARKAKIRYIAISPLLVIMAVAFLIEPRTIEAPSDFTEQYATAPGMGLYMACFLGIFALSMLHLIRTTHRYTKNATRPLVRLGSRLMAAGGILGLVFILNKAVSFYGLRYGFDSPINAELSRACIAIGIILVLTGVTIPAAGPRLAALYRWPQRRRAYRELHPLWLAIYNTTPAVVFTPPRQPDKNTSPGPIQAHTLLLRRIIEIRDGALALRPYLDPHIAATAETEARNHGLTGTRMLATIEAARIAAAIETARRLGPTPPPESTPDALPLANVGAEDLDADAAALAPVAQAYAHSPVVARIARQAATEATSAT